MYGCVHGTHLIITSDEQRSQLLRCMIAGRCVFHSASARGPTVRRAFRRCRAKECVRQATVVFLVQHPGDALLKARVKLALVRRPARRNN